MAGMFDINVATHTPDNFKAGPFPIATEYGTIETGATIRPRTPLVQGTNGIREAAANTLDKLVGISAAEPSGDEVIYYLTGEFFAQAIHMPEGVTPEALKPELRKLSIFLRDRAPQDGDPTNDSENSSDRD